VRGGSPFFARHSLMLGRKAAAICTATSSSCSSYTPSVGTRMASSGRAEEGRAGSFGLVITASVSQRWGGGGCRNCQAHGSHPRATLAALSHGVTRMGVELGRVPGAPQPLWPTSSRVASPPPAGASCVAEMRTSRSGRWHSRDVAVASRRSPRMRWIRISGVRVGVCRGTAKMPESSSSPRHTRLCPPCMPYDLAAMGNHPYEGDLGMLGV
jgi:hypothetical protein